MSPRSSPSEVDEVSGYDPVVGAPGSPYLSIPGDAMDMPDLPSPSLRLSVTKLGRADTQLSWNTDGANQFYAYVSATADFTSYAPVAGSPTSGTSLTHYDAGESRLFLKVLEIPISE